MDMLGGYRVGRGRFADAGIIDNGLASGQSVDDTQIQQMLNNDITQGLLQPPTNNRLYVVYTAPDVVVTAGGENSLRNFYGYHNAFIGLSGKPIYYAVIAHPAGNGDFGTLNDFDTLTKATSHEVADGVTNPGAFVGFDPGGWFGDFPNFGADQEIADVANDTSHLGTLSGYVIQGVWSQQQRMDILPEDNNGPAPNEFSPRPANLQGIANYFTHSAEHYMNLVQYDYQHYLGRLPAPTELNSWVLAMQSGMSDEQVLANFIGSPEFYRHTGGTDSAWVKAIYADLLTRSPSQDEVNRWLQTLAIGTTRFAAAWGFATSAEAEGIVVRNDYQAYLGRQASVAEIAGWVADFQAGVSNELVVAGFLGSAEYYYAAAKGNGADVTWITSLYRDVLHRKPNSSEVNGWYQLLITS
jgi:hypothetical protein